MSTKKHLVLYSCKSFPLRATTWDHLYSFARYSPVPTLYCNLAYREVPASIRQNRYTAIFFHTLFATNHWSAEEFPKLLRKVEWTRKLDCPKIFLPQDEFIH